MNRSVTLFGALAASAVLVAGCGDTQDQDVPLVRDAPPAAEAPLPEAAQSQGDDLQSRLLLHMSLVRAADVGTFRQVWPEHESLVREMLADCRQMMDRMGMTPPRRFTDVEAALESDLERIPELNDAELESLLPEHLDRVQAVIDMRQDMMDDMT